MIRSFKKEDIKEICEIYNYYILNSSYTLEYDALSEEVFLERIEGIMEEFPFFVYEENGEILGYAYLSKLGERKGYQISCDLSIYVKNGLQRKNIGFLLLQEAVKQAKEKKYENMFSIITDENIASIKFHEKNGFVLCGHLKQCAIKFGRKLGVMYYQKSLL